MESCSIRLSWQATQQSRDGDPKSSGPPPDVDHSQTGGSILVALGLNFMTALGCHGQGDHRFQSWYPSLSLGLGTNCNPETLDRARSSWRIVGWWNLASGLPSRGGLGLTWTVGCLFSPTRTSVMENCRVQTSAYEVYQQLCLSFAGANVARTRYQGSDHASCHCQPLVIRVFVENQIQLVICSLFVIRL